jgi:hypothetical protein
LYGAPDVAGGKVGGRLEVEDEEGHRDGEEAIAEGFDTMLAIGTFGFARLHDRDPNDK